MLQAPAESIEVPDDQHVKATALRIGYQAIQCWPAFFASAYGLVNAVAWFASFPVGRL